MSDAPVRESIQAGLARVDLLTPGQGFVELTAGARGAGRGVTSYLRGEVGRALAPGMSLFGYGEGRFGGLSPGWEAGVGWRYRF